MTIERKEARKRTKIKQTKINKTTTNVWEAITFILIVKLM